MTLRQGSRSSTVRVLPLLLGSHAVSKEACAVWSTVVNTPEMLLEDSRALELNALFRPEGADDMAESGNPYKNPDLHMLRSPMNLGASPFAIPSRAPHLGQHTEQVLAEKLGYTEEQARAAMGTPRGSPNAPNKPAGL